MSITDQIQKVRSEFRTDLENLSSENGAVDQIRIKYLGRKGLVSSLFIEMGKVDSEERPKMGKILNKLKFEITLEIDDLSAVDTELSVSDVSDVDFTLPGDPLSIGSVHPLTQVLEEIKSISCISDLEPITSASHCKNSLNLPFCGLSALQTF